jgi:hypothetical protein
MFVRCGRRTIMSKAFGHASVGEPNCGVMFAVCASRDRGQRYCSERCRSRQRRNQVRAAGKRYQASKAGKRAHCRRQQAYRVRLQSSWANTRSAISACPSRDGWVSQVPFGSLMSSPVLQRFPPALAAAAPKAENASATFPPKT